jgi:hypothetical protein
MGNTTTFSATKLGEKTVERYRIDLQISEQDIQRFKSNPFDFLKEQLESNGYQVNRINGDKDLLIKRFDEKASFEWLHTVYPEGEKSEWNYYYLD